MVDKRGAVGVGGDGERRLAGFHSGGQEFANSATQCLVAFIELHAVHERA